MKYRGKERDGEKEKLKHLWAVGNLERSNTHTHVESPKGGRRKNIKKKMAKSFSNLKKTADLQFYVL